MNCLKQMLKKLLRIINFLFLKILSIQLLKIIFIQCTIIIEHILVIILIKYIF